MRLLCEHLKQYSSGKFPCRKVLCGVEGKIVNKTEDTIVVEGEGKVILKCIGCRKQTTINFIGGK